MGNTTGGFNTASGINALVNNTTGSSNTALGDSAGFSVTSASHAICIGANVQGENASNTCYIGNIFGVTCSLPSRRSSLSLIEVAMVFAPRGLILPGRPGHRCLESQTLIDRVRKSW